jgi:hypothetical protein
MPIVNNQGGITRASQTDAQTGTDNNAWMSALRTKQAVENVAHEYSGTQNFNATTLTSTTNAVAWDASVRLFHTL